MLPKIFCTVCHSDRLETALDLGYQPPANRFINADESTDNEERFKLALGFCQDCGTVQLTKRMPNEAIRPRYEWLLYNEPEGHLDDVVLNLHQLPGMNEDSRIVGTTYKDITTLQRFKNLGINNTACINESDFKGLPHPFGLETIQDSLQDESVIGQIHDKYGKADLLVVRHIIEHSTSAKSLLQNLSKLLKPGGYIVLEMPDSEHIFKAGNHGFIWEEHISYFTSKSIYQIAMEVGAELVWKKRYPYPYEDSLITVLKFGHENYEPENTVDQTDTKKIIREFATSLDENRIFWRKTLMEYKSKDIPVAVFGAGHLAVKFINFLELGDLIDCVIDDHPEKKQCIMPGSHLEIVSSAELSERNIKICISTLSPESEVKVKKKLPEFFSSGGVFIPASIPQK
tara:strand:- start:1956 stop:3155 length:1200 start_codon:yes stop_codon:yes gene_type:complete